MRDESRLNSDFFFGKGVGGFLVNKVIKLGFQAGNLLSVHLSEEDPIHGFSCKQTRNQSDT
jgi:hypothetical protein